MPRKRENTMFLCWSLRILILFAVTGTDCASNRRHDLPSRDRSQYLPSPSVETLKELAEAMGAAGFEHYTEGSAKPIVKRLIPQNSEPDLDEVKYEGIAGKPGVDFPAFPNIPATSFNCRNVPTGYYADLETDCQVFHICDTNRKISFLCPNGTIFSQSHLICDWWFKVDCASAPAQYETSAEQYSLAQKKARKQPDLQQIAEVEDRQQLRKQEMSPIIVEEPIASSTERHNKYRTRQDAFNNVRATARSFHSVTPENHVSTPRPGPFEALPTSRSNAFEKRRKNLVQLIANNFGQARTTLPSYTDASTYRTTAISRDNNGLKEMQVAAESASFANSNNRQYLQQTYNVNNFKPYPVYSPTPNTRASKSTAPTFTTAFGQEYQNRNAKNRATTALSSSTFTTKRPTLVPYTKVYGNVLNEKHEPYTRPGVFLLKEYLDKEKNKTENPVLHASDKSDSEPIKISFESVTKIPASARSEDGYFTASASSDRYELFSNHELNQISTEPTNFNRRERLSKKLNLPVTATETTANEEKYFGRRPGLIVPPSLTPKTLHSLAIYYATALDNLSTTTESDENQTTTFFPEREGENNDDLPPIFSQATIEKYTKLFSMHGDHSDLLQELKLDVNGTNNELNDDLTIQQSEGSLSSSPQIRELAQVFTHALSAYLQDPVQFRKVLSDIRPTQPSFGDMMTTSTSNTADGFSSADGSAAYNEDDDEILGFSDDNKSKLPSLAQLRDAQIQTTTASANYRSGKSLSEVITTPVSIASSTVATEYGTTKSPYRCCGSISASYTTISTEKPASSTFGNLAFAESSTNKLETYTATTENSYTVPKYGGFQNNTYAPYGKGVQPTNAKPLNSKQYSEATNLPEEWGKNTESYEVTTTTKPITTSQNNIFDVNNLDKDTFASTTNTPTTTFNYISQFVTESESFENENEEELQRAHSQSFVSPNNNNVHRHGKNIIINSNKNQVSVNIKKPSSDLELPSQTEINEPSTTDQPPVTEFYSTTAKYFSDEESASTVFPYSDGITTTFDSVKINSNSQKWSNNFDSWHSTVILDPITLNDGLSAPKEVPTTSQIEYQFTTTQNYPTDQSFVSTTLPTTELYKYQYNTNAFENAVNNKNNERYSFASAQRSRPVSASLVKDTESSDLQRIPTARGGRLISNPLTTESPVTITEENNMAEIAKEIMGGLNETTTDKLMNVMMKTKSKTVRRLILLLVQTCDDDHNKTAEASKKALLDALMAVSQKDDATTTEAITVIPTERNDFEKNRLSNTHRRIDRITDFFPQQDARYKQSQRSGKSIRVDPNAVNALKNPPFSVTTISTSFSTSTEPVKTTQAVSSTTPKSSRRGLRKYLVRTSPVDTKLTSTTSKPIAEARVLSSSLETKQTADNRALELLRSLYTIAARWG